MPKKLNVIGDKYGMLTVLEDIPPHVLPSGQKKRMVLSRCECGELSKNSLDSLRGGNTRSCGCLKIESISNVNKTHGMSKTPEFRVWQGMKSRCKDMNNSNYGGKGIKVCKRWKKFENFLKDMGKRPSSHHSIDRIDGDKDYEPSNCRWVTVDIQNRNRKTNRKVFYEGKEWIVSDLAVYKGIDPDLLYQRLDRDNLPLDVALMPKDLREKKGLKARRQAEIAIFTNN